MRKSAPTFMAFFLLLTMALYPWPSHPQGWSGLAVRSLPDASFAVIEVDSNGNKVRHCPYKDGNGSIDMEQVIYCLGTLGQETWVREENRELARKNLSEHYQRFRLDQLKEDLKEPVDINTATLKELVRLPNIGPVTAVRIYTYRETNGPFQSIEEIKGVEGIGPAIFDGIRFYITVR
jgi:competence ComEA-like helix-hairpin-helix protein